MGIAKQNGIATLAISLMVLLSLSIVTLFTAQSLISEQRIASNSVRGEQAFSSAQAGLNYAINYLEDNRSTVTDGYEHKAVLPSGSYFHIKYNYIGSNNLVKIESTGFSSDGAVSRKVAQMVKYAGDVSSAPDYPLQTRSNVTIENDGTISNFYGSTTIVMGSNNLVMKDNAQTVLSSGVASTKDFMGKDIIMSDATLATISDADLQKKYLGDTIVNLMGAADIKYSGDDDNVNFKVLDGMQGVNVGIKLEDGEGTAVLKDINVGSSGSLTNLYVYGNVKIEGNTNYYGNIFATGSIEIKGNAVVHGMLFSSGWSYIHNNAVVNGAAISGNYFRVKDKAQLNYMPKNIASNNVVSGHYGRVFGSWQDMGN